MVRTITLGTVQYSPGIPPENAAEMRRFLLDEFNRIAAAISLLAAGHIDKTYVAPPKPRDGDIRMADGASWNPGSGAGVYAYYGAAWHFLG